LFCKPGHDDLPVTLKYEGKRVNKEGKETNKKLEGETMGKRKKGKITSCSCLEAIVVLTDNKGLR
jgi:hypothetical protein